MNGPGAAATPLSLAELEAFDPRHVQRGGETDCLCPFCGAEKRADASHRSLSYNRQSGLWNCHRCGRSGKLSEFRDDSRPEPRHLSAPRRDRARQDLNARFRLSSAKPAAAAPSPLPLPDPDRAARWGSLMGCLRPLAGTDAGAYLESRGLPVDFCHAAGVRSSPDWFGVPAAVFPLRDSDGKLIAAQGRAIALTINGAPNKRTFNRSGSMGVFATADAWTSPIIVLTEAPIDALSLALCGVPALALCGKELGAVRSSWLLPRFYGRHVLLAFDGDEAGNVAAVKIGAEMRAVGALTVRRLSPEGAKDWNEALKLFGLETLAAQLLDILPKIDEALPIEAPSLIDPVSQAERPKESDALLTLVGPPEWYTSAERIGIARAAAEAGEMPAESVRLAAGTTTADPGAYVLRGFARIESRRGMIQARSWKAYLDATLNERIGISAIADWWADRQAPAERRTFGMLAAESLTKGQPAAKRRRA